MRETREQKCLVAPISNDNHILASSTWLTAAVVIVGLFQCWFTNNDTFGTQVNDCLLVWDQCVNWLPCLIIATDDDVDYDDGNIIERIIT